MMIPRESLWSYDNVHHARAEVHRVESLDSLRAVLSALSAEPGRRATVRGGGWSLDAQSLNDDAVIVLSGERFDFIDAPREGPRWTTVRLGAATRWWEVLDYVAAQGFVPATTVTGSEITVGGSLAADCLSRFAGAWGKEGESIESFRVMTVDGALHDARRDARPGSLSRRLFDHCVGGFGALGVVVDVTWRLRRVVRRGPARAAATRFEPICAEGFSWDECLGALRAHTLAARRAVDARGDEAWRRPLPSKVYDAVSATIWFRRRGPRGLLMRSRHVAGATGARSALYGGVTRTRIASELMMTLRVGSDVGQTLFRAVTAANPETRDALSDFTFFMDGNVAAGLEVAAGSLPGAKRMTRHQQTFIVPDEGAARFCERVEALMADAALHPTVLDLLYLPADRRDFPMSPNRGIDGFAITLAYQGVDGARLPAARRLFRRLSRLAASLGGRVSLVKNVYCDDTILRGMYADGIESLRALKRELDPAGLLCNRFLDRLMGAPPPLA